MEISPENSWEEKTIKALQTQQAVFLKIESWFEILEFINLKEEVEIFEQKSRIYSFLSLPFVKNRHIDKIPNVSKKRFFSKPFSTNQLNTFDLILNSHLL